MEERGELVRRAGEGGMCTARWQGVVRETSPMPGRQQPRCHWSIDPDPRLGFWWSQSESREPRIRGRSMLGSEPDPRLGGL